MNGTKLKIGEFSRLMQVTVKTLRHYEEIGILKPCEVDPWTSYRYYELGQMQKLEKIRHLKEVGFSLEEIREMLESNSPVPDIGQLESKIRACEEELKILLGRRERLQQMLDSQRKLDSMDKISIQSLPEIIVASHRETIPDLEALGPMCVNVIGPEMQLLGCKCPPPGYCFTIEHGEEFSPTGIDIEYCEQVEEIGNHPVQEAGSRAHGHLLQAPWPLQPVPPVVRRSVQIHRERGLPHRRPPALLLH